MLKFYSFCKTFSILTAECEHWFSLMNNICIKFQVSLTMKNIANLIFIYSNDHPVDKWNPEYYVKSSLNKQRNFLLHLLMSLE